MQFRELEIAGVWLIEPQKFGDQRGYFLESFKRARFEEVVGAIDFLQDNESKSSYGVIRGLHFQAGEASQAKLVRAVVGRVLDVVVDLRAESPTFGHHLTMELSEENCKQLFVPRGCAHGFAVLSPTAIFSYKVDNLYAPESERTLQYDDASLGIDWQLPMEDRLLSAKDKMGTPFSACYRF